MGISEVFFPMCKYLFRLVRRIHPHVIVVADQLQQCIALYDRVFGGTEHRNSQPVKDIDEGYSSC